MIARVWMTNMRHQARFCKDWSIRCWNMATSHFFKMADGCHIGFVMCKFGLPTKSIWCIYHFAKLGSNQCTSMQ